GIRYDLVTGVQTCALPISLIETPWSAAILDFVFPDTRGQRPADFETTLKFGIALTRLAAEDPAVHKLTMEVQHLLKPRSVYRDQIGRASCRERVYDVGGDG